MNGIAVFDFDDTVIRGDSVTAMIFYARKKGVLSAGELLACGFHGLLYRLRLSDALTAKAYAHRFLKRMPADERLRFLREFARLLTNRAYPEALREIQRYHAAGMHAVLCSASCECYMRFVAENLRADALLCTPCDPDGTVRGPNCRGEEKVRRLDRWLAENGMSRNCLAAGYGDSKGDIPMLLICGKATLVNPSNHLRRRLPSAETVRWKEQQIKT
ncbi:MAG: haloacid dehalogenase-like hydrolase [Clostridia bacterium]|nr:haloacid dehalogenase-like hydrolase [Clostridia bacterium]